MNRHSILLSAVGLALLALAPLNADPQGYLLRVMCLILLFAAMGQAWNIVGGLAAQVSLGHAAYFGIGAYTSTLLLVHFGLSPWIGAVAGMVLAGLFSALLSLPTARLTGHYFALATLAAGEALRVIANSWTPVTGGSAGLSVPYRPGNSIWHLQFADLTWYYYLFLAALLLVTLLFWSIKRSAFGYRLCALRQNEEAAEVIGIDTYREKLRASIISAVITAMLGTLYAQFQFFFDPDTIFSLANISVKMALIAILGGVGAVFGPWVGALFIVLVEEGVNTAFGSAAAGLSQFSYGGLLVLVVLIEPRGLFRLAERLGLKFRRVA